MAKSENENVYFPHFVSARHDRKIRRLRRELGVEGYGIFFMLLEVLREQSDMRYPMDDIDLLAEEFGTSEQKIRVAICNYGLFQVDDQQFFYSPKQIEYLKPYLEKSNRAKHAALIRWHGNDANAYANALPEQSKSNANAMQGEERNYSKGEERNAQRTESLPPVTILDLPEAERKGVVMAQLEATQLSEEQRELYWLKIASNEFAKPRGKKMLPINIASIRADAELNLLSGWLDKKRGNVPPPETGTNQPGGYWK